MSTTPRGEYLPSFEVDLKGEGKEEDDTSAERNPSLNGNENKLFVEALGLIEDERKRFYLEALERCPDVVRNESPPEIFLAACDFDPWQASKRICEYWVERVKLFGKRAYFPVIADIGVNEELLDSDDNNDEGPGEQPIRSALTEQEIEILETGSVQVLPPERSGRTVVFMDRSRLKPHMHHLTRPRLRALWYVLQKAVLQNSSTENGKMKANSNTSNNDNSSCAAERRQSHRVVMLALACKPPSTGFDWEFPKGCRLVSQVLPMRTDEIHLLTLPATSGTGRLLQAVITALLNMSTKIIGNTTAVHYGACVNNDANDDSVEPDSSQARLLKELKKYGFNKKGLPSCAGGNFNFERFANWLSRQRCSERHLYLTASELENRKRQRNNIHSRQKRQRRQLELEKLQNEVNTLKQENAEAKQVFDRLERLLQSANGLVTALETQYDSASLEPVPLKPHSNEAAMVCQGFYPPEDPGPFIMAPDPVELPCKSNNSNIHHLDSNRSSNTPAECYSGAHTHNNRVDMAVRLHGLLGTTEGPRESRAKASPRQPPLASDRDTRICNNGQASLPPQDGIMSTGTISSGTVFPSIPVEPNLALMHPFHESTRTATSSFTTAPTQNPSYSPFTTLQAVFPFLVTSTNYASTDPGDISEQELSTQRNLQHPSTTESFNQFPVAMDSRTEVTRYCPQALPQMSEPASQVQHIPSLLPSEQTFQDTNNPLGTAEVMHNPSLLAQKGKQEGPDHHLSVGNYNLALEENGWDTYFIHGSSAGNDLVQPLLEPLEQTENIFP